MLHTFTDHNFQSDVLASPVPVLVDFWAPWCGPCRMVGPIVEELAREIDPSKIKIGKLNVDEHRTIAQQYGILSIPTLLLFKGGAVVDQVVGVQSKAALQQRIARCIE